MKTIYKSLEGKKQILNQYEEYLTQFDSLIGRDYVKTRFGTTHILLMGKEDAKPLFIFQGGNCINPVTLSWFNGLLEEYRVYAPDTIGHPGYSDETRISASDESFAQWIADLMDYYKVENAHSSVLHMVEALSSGLRRLCQKGFNALSLSHLPESASAQNLK